MLSVSHDADAKHMVLTLMLIMPYDKKCHTTPYFEFPDLRYTMLALMMLLVLHNADANTT